MNGRLMGLVALGTLALAGTANAQRAELASTAADSGATEELAPASSATQAAKRAWIGGKAWNQWDQATGDWAGLRSRLAANGLGVALTITNDASSVVAGGLQRGTASRALMLANVTADLGQALGWKGATVNIGAFMWRGSNGSELVGDIQAFSNIDADRFAHFNEVWLQQSFGNGLRIKAGRIDANVEFAAVGAAGSFITSSAGFSPTIAGLPTYPNPKAAINVIGQPTKWLQLSGGVFQGTFETLEGQARDRFIIGQAQASWTGGYLHVGRWQHTGAATRFDGGVERNTSDWYAAIEQRVSGADGAGDAPAHGVRLFAKYGHAPQSVSAFQQHAMAGLVLDGGLRARAGEQLGLAVTHVDLSDIAEAGFQGNETSFEAFYQVPLFSSIQLRPDFQYIVRPSGSMATPSALVTTLRVVMSF